MSKIAEQNEQMEAVTLNKAQGQVYAALLADFKHVVHESHGDPDQGLDVLSIMEDFLESAAQEQGVEYKFNLPFQFNGKAESVEDHLNMFIRRRVEIVNSAEGDADLRQKMLEAGSTFVFTNKAFIKPDKSKSVQTGSGKGGEFNKFDQRFKPVVELLVGSKINGHEFSFADLNIPEGVVSDETMRNQPFNVIQIPKIGMEVAVCNLYGQSLMLSNEIHHPTFYESHGRKDLKALGLQSVNFAMGWENRLLDKMAADWPETMLDVDMPAHAKDMAKKKKKSDLSVAIVGLALLKYGALNNYEMANQHTPGLAPDMPDKWVALNSAGKQGNRNMPKDMDIAAVKRYYGWNDKDNKHQPEKFEADITHYQETGEMPKPVMSVEDAIVRPESPDDLSPAIVGLALLKYGARNNGKMASIKTPGFVPDMPDTWEALDSSGRHGNRTMPEGMDLPAVKRYYGWLDKDNKHQPEKFAVDIAHYQETGEMPEPVMSIEEAIIKPEAPDDLSPAINALALLKYGALNDGEMANAKTPGFAPDMPDTWTALDASGRHGIRKMPKGMDIAAVKRYFGWNDKNNKLQEEKFKADIAHYEEIGEMPAPVMSVEEATQKYKPDDLSPAIVALALLKHGALKGGEMANQHTPGFAPDMKDRWNGLNEVGRAGIRKMPEKMGLAKIKQICGWVEEGKYKPAGAFKDQWETDIAYFKEHGEMSDDLLTRLERGVAEHIAQLEASKAQPAAQEPAALEL